MIKMRLILLAAELAWKNRKYVLILLLFPILVIVFAMAFFSSLTSWMNWGDEDPDQLKPYQDIAAEHSGLVWQQMLAIDLVQHNMSQDDLDAEAMVDVFIYYITDADGNKIEVIRSFDQVMKYLNFSAEQKQLATDTLSLYYEQSGGAIISGGNKPVSAEVLKYEELVRNYAIQYGVEKYTDILMAMIMQESAGKLLDVMQSSGAAGHTITDPTESIMVGVKYFSDAIRAADGDVKLALQSYNFGLGFINYAKANGGYSKENAIKFSLQQAAKQGWSRYGDVDYADHVLQYVRSDVNPEGGQKFNVKQVQQIMEKYLGIPYLLGGRRPEMGGLDCSGLMELAFDQVGINIHGTAQDQHGMTTPIKPENALPGDLVFFNTGGRVYSHVGMYVGNDQFINANNQGVVYSKLSNNYWKTRFLGFGRIQ